MCVNQSQNIHVSISGRWVPGCRYSPWEVVQLGSQCLRSAWSLPLGRAVEGWVGWGWGIGRSWESWSSGFRRFGSLSFGPGDETTQLNPQQWDCPWILAASDLEIPLSEIIHGVQGTALLKKPSGFPMAVQVIQLRCPRMCGASGPNPVFPKPGIMAYFRGIITK